MYTIPRQPRTQTISRRTIKGVESRIRGYAGMRGLADVVSVTTPDWQLGTPLGNVGGTGTSQGFTLSQFMDIISGRAGERKVEATQFAEGMVKLMYGLEPDCRMPQPGIPVVANANPPKFCGSSVAGAIERCRLNEASASLNYINQQLQSRSNDGSQTAPLIKNWFDQYGRNDISSLNGIILASRAVCGTIGTIGKVCQTGYHWDFSRLQCVPGETGSGGVIGSGEGLSTNTIMLMGAAALAFVFLMKR